jgi:phosphatidate cytidylyltransferase
MSVSNQHSLRWKTAIVLLAIISTVAFIDNKILTWLFFGVVYSLAVKESLTLFKMEESLTLYLILVSLWVMAYFYPHPPELIFIGLMLVASITAYNRTLDIKSIFPLLYPTAGILFFWALYLGYGMKYLFLLLVIVAFSDVGAYYTGKNFGKRKFSPTSPNKTLEGVIGGIFFGSLGGLLVLSEFSFSMFIVTFFTSISSIFGDLFESYLKREAGVKDSGDILPGHGGVLDRIDGYLFGSITLFILLNLLTK